MKLTSPSLSIRVVPSFKVHLEYHFVHEVSGSIPYATSLLAINKLLGCVTVVGQWILLFLGSSGSFFLKVGPSLVPFVLASA